MSQEEFLELSRKIGYDYHYVQVPTLDEADKLLKAAESEDEKSYTQIISVQRFGKVNHESHSAAMDVIFKAFEVVRANVGL